MSLKVYPNLATNVSLKYICFTACQKRHENTCENPCFTYENSCENPCENTCENSCFSKQCEFRSESSHEGAP